MKGEFESDNVLMTYSLSYLDMSVQHVILQGVNLKWNFRSLKVPINIRMYE